MKKLFIICVIFALNVKSQTKGDLDTMNTIGGVTIDKNIAQTADPKECDTCFRYSNKDAVYQLQKHSILQGGFWLKQQPLVRAYEYYIYKITQVYERKANDSLKYVAYKTMYGNPINRDTIINGKQLQLFKWESQKRRLLYIPFNDKFILVLTAKEIENEILRKFYEKNLFDKRDEIAKEQLKNLPVTGTGKNTFAISLAQVEKVLMTSNITSLQNQFAEWFLITDDFETNVGWPFNEKTQQRDVPEFKVNYMTKIKGANLLICVKVPKSLSEKIYTIEVSTQMDGLKYAELKQSVKTAGYLLNEQLTQIFHKETYQHKTKPYTITLNYYNSNAFIGVSDSKRYNMYYSK